MFNIQEEDYIHMQLKFLGNFLSFILVFMNGYVQVNVEDRAIITT